MAAAVGAACSPVRVCGQDWGLHSWAPDQNPPPPASLQINKCIYMVRGKRWGCTQGGRGNVSTSVQQCGISDINEIFTERQNKMRTKIKEVSHSTSRMQDNPS